MKLRVRKQVYNYKGKRYEAGDTIEVDKPDEISQDIAWGKLMIEDTPEEKNNDLVIKEKVKSTPKKTRRKRKNPIDYNIGIE